MDRQVLAPLGREGIKQRLFVFVDDVIIFLRPGTSDLSACVRILDIFGSASGLHVNINKTAAILILSLEEQVQQTATEGVLD